jgi:energy-coupling factor transporter ATP-binding protein EcfA2
MIEARNLSKRYGGKLAVDDLSFTVTPGKVTGFLGPNGAGKSTTMRLLVGLDRPDTGHAGIGGIGGIGGTGILPIRCVPSGRCWRRRPRTVAVPPATTCCAWHRPRACRPSVWTR